MSPLVVFEDSLKITSILRLLLLTISSCQLILLKCISIQVLLLFCGPKYSVVNLSLDLRERLVCCKLDSGLNVLLSSALVLTYFPQVLLVYTITSLLQQHSLHFSFKPYGPRFPLFISYPMLVLTLRQTKCQNFLPIVCSLPLPKKIPTLSPLSPLYLDEYNFITSLSVHNFFRYISQFLLGSHRLHCSKLKLFHREPCLDFLIGSVPAVTGHSSEKVFLYHTIILFKKRKGLKSFRK